MAPVRFSQVFALILLCGPIGLIAAPPPVEWAKIVGESRVGREISCYDAATDSQNNIYIATGPNFGLAKYSASGDFLWRNGIAIDDSIHLYEVDSVIIMGDDTVYSAGQNEIGAFGPGGVARYALPGHRPLAVGPDGSSLFGVSFPNSGTTYQGVTYSSTAYIDAAVFRAGPGGNWARRITGGLDDYVDSLAMTGDGDALISISSSSSAIGIAGLTLSGGGHYLVSIDPAGNAKWSKSFSSDTSVFTRSKPRSIIHYEAATGTLLWAADFIGTVNLGSSISTSGGSDVLIARVTTSGNVLWAKKAAGGSGNQYVSSLIVDRFGNIYLGGYFTGQLSIGSSTFTSAGQEDLYVAKFDKDGNALWAMQIGSTGRDIESGLAMTTDNQLVLAGTIAGGVLVGNVFIEGAGPTDAFIAKFQSEGLPPAFSLQPKSRIVSGGAEIRLTSEVASALPVTYQWFFNGALLTGQTSPILTIPSAIADNAGTYYVMARNAAGEVKSDTVSISYTDAASLTLEMHPTLTIFGTVGQIYRIDAADIMQIPFVWATVTNITVDRTPLIYVDLASPTDQRVYRAVLQR